MKGQLTLRGVVIGCIGCALITASSVYVALKMGALPWPIIFAALLSLFALRAITRRPASLNEANVTHTIMSSGAMVAGGLAFTIPGAWMLGLGDGISTGQLLVIALAGSAVGLVASIALRRHFVEQANLEFPLGQAAAETLKAGNAGSRTGAKLFGAMGFAGVWALLRDALHVIPSMVGQLAIPGVTFGIYASPMMLAVGFLVGTGAMVVWFAGAVFANFGIIVGAPAFGVASVESAQQVASCLGMGCMMGCGVAVIVRDILPLGVRTIKAKAKASRECAEPLGLTATGVIGSTAGGSKMSAPVRNASVAILALAAAAVAACIALELPLGVAALAVACAFVACAMSAQSVGQTSIDPMEIFGLIALFLVAVVANVGQLQLFFVAALVAVACGLAGDVMNDFKAGAVLGTDPRAQWVGQGIGALVGSVVAALSVGLLFTAYGPDAFGVGREFVSAQASVVATMVGGVPNMPAFLVGAAAGFALYLVRFPAMMLGLGMYLPFYMSLTAFLGVVAKAVVDLVRKAKLANLTQDERTQRQQAWDESGLVIASGLLGGESVMGIVLAMLLTGMAFMG
ncbi:MAG: peptide transporter [Eggerthellaceae bacterium]|nr:peptide transporter [Eggerthellaceae bacterium]